MSHRHKKYFQHKDSTKIREQHRPVQRSQPKLEIVLKCDSSGSIEAITAVISKLYIPRVAINIIHSGVGPVNSSDILIAETGSRLIVAFQVDVLPGLESILSEHQVETRLYDVIYTLTADVRDVAEHMLPPSREDQITGSAKVVALFKGSRRGIIIGCEVLEGQLAHGQHFRIISAVGPVYSGTVESMHMGNKVIQKAVSRQQVGIKIKNFNKVKIGDLIESYRRAPVQKARTWKPEGKIIQIRN
jgi:translation initiation factor IF-2